MGNPWWRGNILGGKLSYEVSISMINSTLSNSPPPKPPFSSIKCTHSLLISIVFSLICKHRSGCRPTFVQTGLALDVETKINQTLGYKRSAWPQESRVRVLPRGCLPPSFSAKWWFNADLHAGLVSSTLEDPCPPSISQGSVTCRVYLFIQY